MKTEDFGLLARRSFLARLGLAGAAMGLAGPAAQAQTTESIRWQPARHTQDDWLDQVPGQHRFVFDTTTPDAFGTAMFYVNNYVTASESAYGLKGSDLAVVIIARHFSTPCAYNDAMWAKHGAALSGIINFTDPGTKKAPSKNLFNSTADILPNHGTTLDGLLKQGVHLGVCQMATTFFSGLIAGKSGDAEGVYRELAANLVPNAHLVPAGIVAVNRAQERGYSFAFTG